MFKRHPILRRHPIVVVGGLVASFAVGALAGVNDWSQGAFYAATMGAVAVFVLLLFVVEEGFSQGRRTRR